jgi:hypothetical protein
MWKPPRIVDYVAGMFVGWVAAGLSAAITVAVFSLIHGLSNARVPALGNASEVVELIGLSLYFAMPLTAPAAVLGVPLAVWSLWQSRRTIIVFAVAGLAAGIGSVVIAGLLTGSLGAILSAGHDTVLGIFIIAAAIAGLLAGAAVGRYVKRMRRPMA